MAKYLWPSAQGTSCGGAAAYRFPMNQSHTYQYHRSDDRQRLRMAVSHARCLEQGM